MYYFRLLTMLSSKIKTNTVLMLSVKQINNFSCVLACIESLSFSKNKYITQQELINLYPQYCHKDEKIEGAVDLPTNLSHILISLGLSVYPPFHGQGLPFLLTHQARLRDGIFLYTMFGHDGKTKEHHCWLLKQMSKDHVVVLEPSAQCPYPYTPLQWDYLLKTRGSIAVVCNTN